MIGQLGEQKFEGPARQRFRVARTPWTLHLAPDLLKHKLRIVLKSTTVFKIAKKGRFDVWERHPQQGTVAFRPIGWEIRCNTFVIMNGHLNGEVPYSINTFKPLLSKLLRQPDSFSPSDLQEALLHLASGKVSHAQTGSFLASLKVTNVWRRPQLVQVLVKFMKDLSGNVNVGTEGNICDWTFTGESGLTVSYFFKLCI